MKRRDRKVHYAWMMLSVFVPMLLLSSLHIHTMVEAVGFDCYECEHHLQHAGHLTTAMPSTDNCLICQMHSENYVPAVVLVVPYAQTVGTFLPHAKACSLQNRVWGSCSPRAPPVVVC